MSSFSDPIAGSTLLAALLGFLAVAVVSDIAARQISNSLVIMMISCGLILQLGIGGFPAVIAALLGVLIGGAALLPMYMAGGMGAGDVKLMGAAGAMLGPAGALIAVIYTYMAGAVLGLAYLSWRFVQSNTSVATDSAAKQVRAYASSTHFPFAPAIAVGCILSLWRAGELGAITSAFG